MGSQDQLVIEAILRGDRDAYESLVKAHAQLLFRLAFRMTRNEADAEEVVQEAFMRAFNKLSSFDARSSFGTWIYRITARCALDKLQTNKRSDRTSSSDDAELALLSIPDTTAGPERILLSHEITALSESALAALTPIERAAFILRHHEDRTTIEIAATLHVSNSAAKQAVYRAVHKLRKSLGYLRQQKTYKGIAHETLLSLD
jgi:RNA polymerase sigma-70 factor (ECF subfamily)